MSTKQRLLFITTGGTIASVRTQQGLKPVLTSEELLAHLPELNELCCPDTLALCSIDSTDLGPEHWLMMAKAVQENYALYDGFIICHGTDTLAYSAAALSYLIQNADKPVILTGAQQPISNEITDAKKNLRDSVICALDPGSRGVMVVFGGHVIAGTRAKKNKTISYDAFASVNFPALALVQGDRLVRYVPSPWPTGPVEFGRSLSLLDQIYWVASAAMGAALGSVLPFSTEGVDFVMTAMFVVIFLNQWEKEKQHASAIIGIAAPLVCLRIFGSGSFLIPSMVCILVALLLLRRPIEAKESEAAK